MILIKANNRFNYSPKMRSASSLTRSGAVPPRWLRASTEPSRVSTSNTSSSMRWSNSLSCSKFKSAKSQPSSSHLRTAKATTS